jgi:hypothetical protein
MPFGNEAARRPCSRKAGRPALAPILPVLPTRHLVAVALLGPDNQYDSHSPARWLFRTPLFTTETAVGSPAYPEHLPGDLHYAALCSVSESETQPRTSTPEYPFGALTDRRGDEPLI